VPKRFLVSSLKRHDDQSLGVELAEFVSPCSWRDNLHSFISRNLKGTTVKIGILSLISILLVSAFVAGQTSTAMPRITDLFSIDETKKAGLSKLNADEITALNTAIFRVLNELVEKPQSRPEIKPPTANDSDDLDFYDSRGRAVAYVASDSDLTIYLWAGKPVAYLDEKNVYGFNGKHLGWFKNGAIYDHDGNIVAVSADRFKGIVNVAPIKGFKQFQPFKSFEQFAPFEPFLRVSWSETPALVFFLGGSK
jgi:hypothetical protein